MNKLDFLMNLTNTRNSILSKAVSFDPSYISRVRSGRRSMPRSHQFLMPLAVYFARNIKTPQQLKLAEDAICPGEPLPEDRELLEELLVSWLAQPSNQETAIEKKLSQTEFFIGEAGKQEAVELYLLRLGTEDCPHELLMTSDESLRWLTKDADYLERWVLLMWQIMHDGSTLHLICHLHSGERMRDIVLERNWLPYYEQGRLLLYDATFLPLGLHRKSMLIARDNSALVSCSLEGSPDGMLTLYTSNKAAVRSLELEYKDHLSRCRRMYI